MARHREKVTTCAAGGVRPAAGARRWTRQRLMIAAVLGETDRFCTAQDVHRALCARGARTGLATVYRVLHSMAQAGEADTVRTGRGEMLYRRCGPGHHHLLICRRCGRAAEVTGSPELVRWVGQSAAEHGYRDVRHQIEVTGVCPGCAARAAPGC